ncbi:MAG TPA: cytochrome b/b6 domain-containing protein [Chloroflexota bacterium]|nr:cytochrome b/b6 domain-containing protein [Chloroflexota bacterium]
MATVTASDRRWVLRFTRTERVAHWLQALTFLSLMLTGLAISLAPVEALIGHRSLLREAHLASALFFVFGPTLVALAGNRRAVAADAEDVDRWTDDDLHWLARPQLEPGPSTPPTGKFNAGQKLNAIFVAYSTFAFGLTGLILWQNRRFPTGVVSQANVIHTDLAYIALAVFLGHVYLAAVHRATRPALHGMVFGTVRREWAARHHVLWQGAPFESRLTAAAAVRAAFLFLVGSEVALLLVRALFEALGANPTDAVTGFVYALTALPATIGHHATGVGAFDLAALFWAGLIGALWIGLRRGQDVVARP